MRFRFPHETPVRPESELQTRQAPNRHLSGSSQVRLLGLERADDTAVWEHAKQHGYVLVSQDADFSSLSSLRGFPPKVIWIRCGNRPTREIEALLRGNHSQILQFLADPSISCLEIG